MATEFENLLRCTISGSAFQLEDFSTNDQAITKDETRVGTSRSVRGTGYILGTDSADFAAKIAATLTALNGSGDNFIIYGPSDSKLYEILAATCNGDGPHCSCSMLGQIDGAPLERRFEFTVTATTGDTGDGSGGGDGTGESRKITTTVTPDAMKKVGQTGELNRAGATAYFNGSILGPFKAAHPARDWIVSHQYQADDRDVSLSYTISAEQLQTPFPGTRGKIVDGTAEDIIDRDEMMRKTVTYVFNLLLSDGDYQPEADEIRATIAAKGAIVRESQRVTRFKQTRLQLSYQLLMGAEGNKLLNWQQKIGIIDPGNGWKETRYPGAKPVLATGSEGLRRIFQAGTAVGAGAFVVPPRPVFPDHLADDSPPSIEWSVENDFEYRVTWAYVMITDEFSPWEPSAATLRILTRPKNPTFIVLPPST